MNATNNFPIEPVILDRHSPLPLYHQLHDVIVDAIHTGKLKPGDQLPSENELIGLFNVSRYVVRQTLNLLNRQGLIITERGRGSFVSPRKIDKPLDVLQSYHASMKQAGINVQVKILTMKIIRPTKEIAAKLVLGPKDRVFQLERIAFVDDSPLNLLTAYIATKNISEKTLLNFPGGSLYEYLAKTCNIRLVYCQNIIEVGFAGKLESRLLNLQLGSVLLNITGVSYDQNNVPIEYSCVTYPANIFRFGFESYIADIISDAKRILVK